MDRIQNHPILGESPEGRKVTFYYDGNPLEGIEGEPIMAALKVNGVDGKPNVRTCITPLAAGMHVQTQYGVQAKKEV